MTTNSSSLVPNIVNLLPTQIAALSTTDVASLTASDFASLSQSQIRAFTQSQIGAITPATFSALGGTFAELSPQEIQFLSTSQIASLTSEQIATLTITKLATLSAHQISAISADGLAALGGMRIASLSTTQIAALNTAQIDTLGTQKLSLLSDSQIAAIDPNAIASLGATRIASLSKDQVASLTSAQFNALNKNELLALGDNGAITASQIADLSVKKMSSLGAAFISLINLANLDYDQVESLTADDLSAISTQNFSGISTQNIPALTTMAIQGLTPDQMNALNSTQLLSFSPKQMLSMSAEDLAVINSVNPLVVQAVELQGNGPLTYGDALTVLQDAASGGMTQTKFDQLQGLANKIQTLSDAEVNGYDDAIVTVGGVKQLFDSVVLGDAENGVFYGGASQSTPLGDLSATSTEAQTEALINKWFFGSDMPSLQSDAAGDLLSASYEQSDVPLYGASGAPTMTDVVGGSLGDSALLAGIAETAFQDPGYLQQLITDNGNGTYTVELPAEFGSTYVTVNDQLPVSQSGNAVAAATSSTGNWVGLLEKAAAQNAVDMSASLGDPANQLGNTYADLTAPVYADDQVALFGGEMTSGWDINSYYSQSAITQNLSAAEQVLNSGLNVVMQVGNDYFAVTGINANNGTVNVYDPSTGKDSSLSVSHSMTGTDTLYYSTVPGRAGLHQ